MNSALKKAYELERRGLVFYVETATKCRNPLARRTLFSLAQDEIKHMMKIDDLALLVDEKKGWAEADTTLIASDIEISIKEFFLAAGKEEFGIDRDNASFIKKAMAFEKKSYDLYADLEGKGKTPEERRFYGALKEQEEKHYEALENVYYYLDRTGDWMAQEESGVWNLMNS